MARLTPCLRLFLINEGKAVGSSSFLVASVLFTMLGQSWPPLHPILARFWMCWATCRPNFNGFEILLARLLSHVSSMLVFPLVLNGLVKFHEAKRIPEQRMGSALVFLIALCPFRSNIRSRIGRAVLADRSSIPIAKEFPVFLFI